MAAKKSNLLNVWPLLCGATAIAFVLLAGGCATVEPGRCVSGTVYVDEFDLSGSTCGLGMRMQAKKSVGGHALTVDGRTYGRGFASILPGESHCQRSLEGYSP